MERNLEILGKVPNFFQNESPLFPKIWAPKKSIHPFIKDGIFDFLHIYEVK